MTLSQFKARAREEFRIEYRKAYENVFPDEWLDEGNPWFESFLDTQFDKLIEEVKGMVPEEHKAWSYQGHWVMKDGSEMCRDDDPPESCFHHKMADAHNACRAEFLRRLSAFMSK